MAGKLKNIDFKQFFIDHGEKVGLGVIVLLVVYALWATNWVPYNEKQPGDITSEVAAKRQAFDQMKITDADRERLGLIIKEEDRPATLVQAGLLDDWNKRKYDLPVEFASSGADKKQPYREPSFVDLDNDDEYERGDLTVLDMIADSYWVLLNLGPEEDETEEGSESGSGSDGSSKPPEPMPPGLPPGLAKNLDKGLFERGSGGGNAGAAGAGAGALEQGLMANDNELMFDYSSAEMDLEDGAGEGADVAMMSGYGDSEGGYATTVLRGRGQAYVSVRGIIPIYELIEAVRQARHCDYYEAADLFRLIDFEMQRREYNPVTQTWSDWEPVDRTTARGILNEVDGFAPDIVPGSMQDVAVTMPLPARIIGRWDPHASHPRIEKFELKGEELEQELKLQEALLKKAQEKSEEIRTRQRDTGPQVKGWNDIMIDANRLTRDVVGADSIYGSGEFDDSSMFGTLSINGSQPDKEIEDLAKELASVESDKKKREALAEYIQKRVTAVGNLLLFRFIDFAVKPGTTYQYRTRLVIANPNLNARVSDCINASVAQGETRLTEWSKPTPSVYVDQATYYFVHEVEKDKGRVQMDYFHYDQEIGTIVSNMEPDPSDEESSDSADDSDEAKPARRSYVPVKHLDVGFGQPIGGNIKDVWVLRPAENTFKKPDPKSEDPQDHSYRFQTEDVLVAALDTVQLNPEEHSKTGLQFPKTKNRNLQFAEAVLVAKGDGDVRRFEMIDSISQIPYLEYKKYELAQQNLPFRDLKKGKERATGNEEYGLGDLLGDDYGEMAGMDEGGFADMASPYSAGRETTRKRSKLRRRRK